MRIIPSLLISLSLSLAIGCGSDGPNDVEPRLIPGGGVGDGAIDGEINITIIDGQTEAPIADATVLVGEPGETPREGLTDSAGLIVFEDPELVGPTTVTAVAEGYAVSTWFGANGANVTIPLAPRAGLAPEIPSATLSGTIDGWGALPEPAANHAIVAYIAYSQTPELGDPANELPPPLGGNLCFKLPVVGGECNWSVNSRTGDVVIYAIIGDLDTKGTADESDDDLEIISFAYKLDTVVEDGVDQSGIVLTQVEPGTMEDVSVTMATPPSGTEASGILAMDLGTRGLVMAGLIASDTTETVRVPSTAGPFAGATYRGFAFANEAVEGGGARSAILLRGIEVLGEGVDFGPWLDLPRSLGFANGTYSFTPVEDAAVHIVDLRDNNGEQVWGIGLLDGRTSFTLPGLDPSPLPAGQVIYQVSALSGDIDVREFNLDELLEFVDRTSANQITFAN